jgi:HEAT repeat protein
MRWIPPGMSRSRAAALIAAPVVVLFAVGAAVMSFAALLMMGAVLAHHSISGAAFFVVMGGGVAVTIAAATVTRRILERALVGPKAEWTDAQRSFLRQTRVVTAVAAASSILLAPVVVSEWNYQRDRHDAQSPGWRRTAGIAALGDRDSIRGVRLLIAIATDRGDAPHVRAAAVQALAKSPRGTKTILALASDPVPEVRVEVAGALSTDRRLVPSVVAMANDSEPEVRVAVGTALLTFADDPRAWVIITRLAMDDESLVVRERMAAALADAHVPRPALNQRLALLHEIAGGGSPAAALSVVKEIGIEGFAIAASILMNRENPDGTRLQAIRVFAAMKDPRAIPVLRPIVMGQFEPGFVSPGNEASYREAAQESLNQIPALTSPAGKEEWMSAFPSESFVLQQVTRLLEAQGSYWQANGRFAARLECLERDARCAGDRDRSGPYLGAVMTSQFPYHGYRRRFEPGIPAPRPTGVPADQSAGLTSFAYLVEPEAPFESGIRTFCADETGTICFTRDGRAPETTNGRCPSVIPLAADDPPVRPDFAKGPRECRVSPNSPQAVARSIALPDVAISGRPSRDVNDESSGEAPICRLIGRTGEDSADDEVIKALRAGASVNVDCAGETPLVRALTRNAWAQAHMLIAAGARVNEVPKYRDPPLHYAVQYGPARLVDLLLRKGAKVDARDRSGTTPLRWANNTRIAEILIAAGADVNARDPQGTSVLARHQGMGHQAVVALLRRRGAVE